MSEYIPSMKAAFYSFEFHKESVDKWESWIIETKLENIILKIKLEVKICVDVSYS